MLAGLHKPVKGYGFIEGSLYPGEVGGVSSSNKSIMLTVGSDREQHMIG